MSAIFDQGNRTFVGSVVFVDIVGYSKKSVSEQIVVKDRFTALLSESLTDIPPEQRLILDTGDGAALSFLGDPEDALFVSMNLRDMVDRAIADARGDLPASIPASDENLDGGDADVAGDLPLRIGINLGPVKLVRDINGHPNIVGDGINVAQRIMSFARPGQIVVSRSFFDVVSVISNEYAKLFKYEGSRTDKHVREHEIYIVGESDEAFKQAKAGTVDRAAATNPHLRPLRSTGTATGSYNVTQIADGGPVSFLQDKRKLMIAGGALLVVVLALAVALILKKPAGKTAIDADSTVSTSTASPAKADSTPAITREPVPVDAAKPADASSTNAAPTIAAPAPSGTAGGDTKAAAAKPEPAKADAAKIEAAKLALLEGRLNLSIQPWGDVFINGKSIGVSPPLKQHKLAPGKYRIDVKNTSFTPFTTNIEIKPKEDVSVRHKFQ